MVHELVTNSAKYGALKGQGHVAIRWDRDDQGDLVLNWVESGGPPVETPTRKGFGTTIIEHSVPYDLGGKAELHYAPEGFHATFVIPGRHVSEVQTIKGPTIHFEAEAHPAEFRRDMLAGLSVMLVEDSLIIALDAEDILRSLGAAEVMTDGTVPGAIAIAEEKSLDLAILDINLGDHTSFAIADRLDDLGVPFMFATGYGDQAQLPERHRAPAGAAKALYAPHDRARPAGRHPRHRADATRRGLI